MTPYDKLKATYDDRGYIVCGNLLSLDLIVELRAIIEALVKRAEGVKESTDTYEFIENTKTGTPRLERINSPHTIHSVFNQLIRKEEIVDILRLLLGPDVRLHGSKLNLKSNGGGSAIEWHQDWAFYPHTNDDVLAVGIMIDDMTPDNGPLMFVPGSHKGPVYDHSSDGFFCGAIQPEISKEATEHADVLTGSAGSVSFHHCRVLHGSKMNQSVDPRRFLLYEIMAADAWPLAGCHSLYDSWEGMNERLICGTQSMTPRLRQVPVRLPQPILPNATSIFYQQRHGNNRIFTD